ncbi:MAG TPA: hypothetical protein VM253_09470 [Candidatus Limnocylindrales bacterium]|nr:hypothetical protein [Candidatus Limnocylindrales bacterium]
MSLRTMRLVAAAAAAGSAVLYYLIGFGVLFIGESTTGENDILGFGLTVGTVFLVAGALVLFVHRRWFVALVTLMNLGVIAGYFALAGVRVPPFEPWGLLIKALQVVLLAALLGLLFRRRSHVLNGVPRHSAAR